MRGKILACGLVILGFWLFLNLGWAGCPANALPGFSCSYYESHLDLLGFWYWLLLGAGLLVSGIGLFLPKRKPKIP